jgi:hypothetical protein
MVGKKGGEPAASMGPYLVVEAVGFEEVPGMVVLIEAVVMKEYTTSFSSTNN